MRRFNKHNLFLCGNERASDWKDDKRSLMNAS